MRRQRGFSLLELFVAIFIFAVLLAFVSLLLSNEGYPARTRNNCTYNLKQFGVALHNYHNTLRTFPAGGIARGRRPDQFAISPHALLLPYFEEPALAKLYDQSKPWRQQSPTAAATVIPQFFCPASVCDNPLVNRLLIELTVMPEPDAVYPPNQPLGMTTYAFCKGVTDAWCLEPDDSWLRGVPVSERGLFDVNWAMSIRQLSDGTANTIAMGEATAGPRWPLKITNPSGSSRVKTVKPDKYGLVRNAHQAWISGEPSTNELESQGLYLGSSLACTLEPINQTPVTAARASVDDVFDCRKSLPSAPGTPVLTTSGGPHSTPNFRSDHSGGCVFLFADGAVKFLSEDIDPLVYQRLSTAMGGEAVEIPE